MPDAPNSPTTPPEPSSETSLTAPGSTPTYPQEQIDRYAALAMRVMQLRNYVQLHRARLPADLVARWDAWFAGLGQVFRGAQTDQVAMRALLAQLPVYEAELAQYTQAFAAHGGPAGEPQTPHADSEPRLSPLMIGGAGLALGAVLGFFVAGSRD